MTLFLMQTHDFVMDESYSNAVLGLVHLATHKTGFPRHETTVMATEFLGLITGGDCVPEKMLKRNKSNNYC